MTVCVAVKVYDCIVLAADSAVTITGQEGVTNVWQHGNKLFHLHKQLPIAAMTAGWGSFGRASVSQLAKDLRILLSGPVKDGGLNPRQYTIGEVVNRANDLFFAAYKRFVPAPDKEHSFQLWIGGYGSHDSKAEMWQCGFHEGVKQEPRLVIGPDTTARVIWGGQLSALYRLLLGFDPYALRQALHQHGLDAEEISTLERRMRQIAAKHLVDAAMPVQDAINLAEFLVDVAKRYSRYHPGANVVGGETDIATITKHERFKWIKRKHYYPADLNIGGKDHAHNTE